MTRLQVGLVDHHPARLNHLTLHSSCGNFSYHSPPWSGLWFPEVSLPRTRGRYWWNPTWSRGHM